MRGRKLFIGEKLRELRESQSCTQAKMAEKLEISNSYYNQLENNQRHVTAQVLMALASHFSVDIASFSRDDGDRLFADLTECLADPLYQGKSPTPQEISVATQNAPNVARSLITMHQALRRAGDRLAELDDTISRSEQVSEPTPYEEVRDYFHFTDNYVHKLDVAGEELAGSLIASTSSSPIHSATERRHQLLEYIQKKHKVKIGDPVPETDVIRHYDPERKLLRLSARNSPSTDAFQITHLIALLEHEALISSIIKEADFRTDDARSVCRLGLANYFAGATLMPYKLFRKSAVDLRHDLVDLSAMFDASVEQIAHRLSTLQRPRNKGVPVFFARVDRAGNITKRHSSTKMQFARFGSACPLWNAHKAFENPGQIIMQLAETPDSVQYMCLALAINKPSGGYHDPVSTYSLALGCEVKYMDQFVYGDQLNEKATNAFEKIGISCRICERKGCHQRALPPMKTSLDVSTNVRRIVPYGLT